MDTAIPAQPAAQTATDRDGTLTLALLLVVPVIAFEQFLHTSPAAQSGSVGYETMYWLSDALLAIPLAASAICAGGWLADRWGFGSQSVWSAFARAGLITLTFAIALIPGWFLHDDLDLLARTAAVASGHSHSHGSDEVHWAGDTVFRLLILVPLASAALWGGERIGRRLARGLARAASLLVRAGVIAVLLAGVVTSAWFLEAQADAADSAQVTYTNAVNSPHFGPVMTHSHSGPTHVYMGPISATATTTEGSPVAKVAHALRDGLAGQAVGLPVMFFALLWSTGRRLSDRRRDRVNS